MYVSNYDRKQKNLIVFNSPNQNFLCIFREQKNFVENLGFEGPKTLGHNDSVRTKYNDISTRIILSA